MIALLVGIQRKMEPLQTDIDNITKNMKEVLCLN